MYLEVNNLKKSYGSDAGAVQVLKGVTTSVGKGQMCVIQGTSGSGKSTLLNLSLIHIFVITMRNLVVKSIYIALF